MDKPKHAGSDFKPDAGGGDNDHQQKAQSQSCSEPKPSLRRGHGRH